MHTNLRLTRHTRAAVLPIYPRTEARVDVFTVQRLAGHADAVTTARYDRRGEGERRRAAAQLRIPVAS